MTTVHTQSGIFSDHLRHLLAALQPHHELKQALTQVIRAQTPLELSPAIAYQLESMGLIKVEGNLATISCGLYQQFFSQYLREC
jgi:serine/threonine-protein kinase